MRPRRPALELISSVLTKSPPTPKRSSTHTSTVLNPLNTKSASGYKVSSRSNTRTSFIPVAPRFRHLWRQILPHRNATSTSHLPRHLCKDGVLPRLSSSKPAREMCPSFVGQRITTSKACVEFNNPRCSSLVDYCLKTKHCNALHGSASPIFCASESKPRCLWVSPLLTSPLRVSRR